MPTTIKAFFWIVAALCVILCGYFAYAYFATPNLTNTQPSAPVLVPQPGFAAASADTTGVVSSAPRVAPQGQQEYRNAAYHISVFYPQDLSVKSYDEGGGASTVSFQNVITAQGFQIFVVPYQQQQISTTRFQEDEPSGVMQSPLNVQIGGIPATSFYSTNAALGDTAEIWFIRGGYLYEVTAPKSEAAWFSGVMNTWEFI